MLLDGRSQHLATTPNALPPAETLLERFNKEYICLPADKPELLRRAYETRFQVYCLENPFENADEHRDGLESDAFDEQSSHCVLMTRNEGEAIGTVRLILPQPNAPESFSLSKITDISGGDCPTPAHSTGEVSRFSISKAMRRDQRDYAGRRRPERPAEPLLSLGLIQGLVRMSRRHGISHWCAVMEPKMLRMLSAMGIHFTLVGALIEHHGLRQLCHCELERVLKTVRAQRPAFWDVITDGGALA